MQMAAKIVYYGPGLCGKTTNLHHIYAKTSPQSRGEMVSLETETDRTLFFDLLPIDVGVIGGFKTRLQLYTIPGQVFYNTTRKLVLKGVDGIVFVADSQRAMLDANLRELQEPAREPRRDRPRPSTRSRWSCSSTSATFPTSPRSTTMLDVVDPERKYDWVEAVAVARRRRLRDAEGDLETDAAHAAPPHDRRGAGEGRPRAVRAADAAAFRVRADDTTPIPAMPAFRRSRSPPIQHPRADRRDLRRGRADHRRSRSRTGSADDPEPPPPRAACRAAEPPPRPAAAPVPRPRRNRRSTSARPTSRPKPRRRSSTSRCARPSTSWRSWNRCGNGPRSRRRRRRRKKSRPRRTPPSTQTEARCASHGDAADGSRNARQSPSACALRYPLKMTAGSCSRRSSRSTSARRATSSRSRSI